MGDCGALGKERGKLAGTYFEYALPQKFCGGMRMDYRFPVFRLSFVMAASPGSCTEAPALRLRQ
jgi:hypothetical protein